MSTRSAYDKAGLGRRLREARIRAGLTQRALAFPGCSYAHVSRIEAGARAPSPPVAAELAARLGITVDFLLTGPDPELPDVEPDELVEAEMAMRFDDRELAASLFEKVAGRDSSSSAVRARAVGGLGQLAFRRGEIETAIDLLERALELSPEAEPAVAEALGQAYAALGDRSSVLPLFGRHLTAAQERGDPTEHVRFAVLLANALILSNQLARADRLLAELLANSDAEPDPLSRARRHWSQARELADQGDSHLAKRYAQRARALLDLVDETENLARAHRLLAFIQLEHGNGEQALELLGHGRRLLDGGADTSEAAMFGLEEARARAQLGEHEAAAARAVALAAELEDADPVAIGRSYSLLAETVQRAGDSARARELYELAIEFLERRRNPYLVDAYAQLGELLERLGEQDQALALYKRALMVQQGVDASA